MFQFFPELRDNFVISGKLGFMFFNNVFHDQDFFLQFSDLVCVFTKLRLIVIVEVLLNDDWVVLISSHIS